MLIVTYLPRKSNDGRTIPVRARRQVLSDAAIRFGGFTLSGPVTGGWHDESGQLYVEENYRLEINAERSQLEEARQWVIGVGRRFGQLAMYFEVRDYDGVQILKVE